MRTVRLGDTTVETTVLGLGTAGLLFEPDRNARRRLIAAALDAGVRHFDVAPMYGLGSAEQTLGRLLRGRRTDVVVATKFGIEPSAVARSLAPFQGRLRRGQKPHPATVMDARAGVAGAVLYRSPGYSAAVARASLERSLRQLGTDYIDVYFVHDPRPGDAASDDLHAFLETATDAGLIRAWGIAGEPDAVAEAEAGIGAGAVLQIRDDIFLRPKRPAAAPSIVFGTLARALSRVQEHLARDAAAGARWSDRLGTDVRRNDALASLLLRDAFQSDPDTAVLIGTTRPERVVAAAQDAVAAQAGDSAVAAFRRLVETEIVRTA